ncbi:hypothetical protein [Zavarzinella formosa]|uniref:hypothetical protein n=1 Tax=Zavarzinella formosa TaxID=360055 RepID=UPI00030F015E|nr:hypothetical protein [Zavarzinella formosa]
MVYLAALLVFVVLKTACWLVSVAVFRNTFNGPDPALVPSYRTTAMVAIGAAALASFIPFPAGYVLGLAVWAWAVFGRLGLKTGKAVVLFGCLAAASFVSRLVVLGVMDFFRL